MQNSDEQRIVLTVQEETGLRQIKKAAKHADGSPLFHVTRQDTGEASILPENNEGLRFFWSQSQVKAEEAPIRFPSWYTSPETPLPQIMDGSVRHYLSANLMHGESVLLVSNGHDPTTEWASIIEMFEDVVSAKARAAGVFSLSGGLPSLASARRSSMDILFSRRCSGFCMSAPTCRISCFEVTKENGLRDLTTGRPVMSTDIGRRRRDGVDIRRIADISTTISNAVKRRTERSHVVIVITVGSLVVELALLNSPAAPVNLDVSRRTKGGVNTHIFTLLSVLKEISSNASSAEQSENVRSIRGYRNSVLTNLLFSPFRGAFDSLKVAVFCKIVNSAALEDSARTMLHFAMDVQKCADVCCASLKASRERGDKPAVPKARKRRPKYVISMAGTRMKMSVKRGALRSAGAEPPRKNARVGEKEVARLREEVERLKREVDDAREAKERLRERFDSELVKTVASIDGLSPEEWKGAVSKALSDFKVKNFGDNNNEQK